jgi:TM2 domain-containing membrane protein YozV
MPVEQTIDPTSQSAYSPYTRPTAPPPGTPPDLGVSPGLAFILGFIPGVGAIYNGQYGKGLIHVLVLGTIISLTSSAHSGAEALFGLMIAAWFFYMAFEAYHTAKRRLQGLPVDEFSSLISTKGRSSRFPVGPVLLIGIGLLFLLNNMDLVRFHDVARYWPILPIALGVYLLYVRLTGSDTPPVGAEAVDERR